MNGVFNLHKPSGPSSNGFLAAVKKRFSLKKLGHLGTLDPLAEGVLPVFSGKMTKLIPYFNNCDKSYRAEIRFGRVSDSYDSEGEVRETGVKPDFSEADLLNCLKSMTGGILQSPPAFSAVKVDGKRAYSLARRGVAVDLPPREVTVYETSVVEFAAPAASVDVRCSKGFYVRTFVHEIGRAMGCGAILTGLRRLSCGGAFHSGNAIRLDLDQKKAECTETLKPMKLSELFEGYNVLTLLDDEGLELIKCGRPVGSDLFSVRPPFIADPTAFVLDESGRPVSGGRLECSQDRPLFFHPRKVLL